MGKKKALAKNIGILTLSQLATKFISFFLIPLYTSILTTADYGTFDLVNSTVAILVPVFTLNISEAAVRFAIDDTVDKKTVLYIGVKYILISNLIMIAGTAALQFIPLIGRYGVYVCLIFFVQSGSSLLISFARGLDQFKEISIASVAASAIVIVSNILFLVVLDYGLDGYFIANILGPLFQIVYLFCRIKVWKYVGKQTANTCEKEMLAYSRPLIANSVGWWVNNVSDRYIVTLFCGLGVNGIYSVASKIPSIMNLLVGIFNQAWTLSSAREFDAEDNDGFFSELYNFYNAAMILSCAVLIALNKILSGFLYSNEFYGAWQYVPFLLIASALGGISGYMGGIFSAVKDSKVIAKTTLAGASVNLVLNIIFVPIWGAIGAAVATLISYWLTYAVRLHKLQEYIHMDLHIVRDNLSYVLLTIQGVWWFLGDAYLLQLLMSALQLFFYRREVAKILSLVRKIWNRRFQ